MRTCTCGARIPDGAGWCPVCLRKPVDHDDLLEELHEMFRKTTWSPPERLVRPPTPKRSSRWRATLFTFGPRVKVPLTVGVVAFVLESIWLAQPWHFLRNDGPGQYVKPFALFQLILTVVGGGLFLWALWRKARSE